MNHNEWFYLEKLRELSNDSRGEFSIKLSDKFPGWYGISIGKYTYLVEFFTEESLFNAYVNILTSIKKDEN